MEEKENILNILSKTKEAIKEGDTTKIKSLSNQTTNTASLTQDPENIAIAVIVYSLSKILERQGYSQLPGWDKFYRLYINSIDNSIKALNNNDEKLLKKNLEAIRLGINKLSGKLKDYIQDVFRKASINKASKIYEHGLSMEKTANLLGITLYELAGYSGERTINEIRPANPTDVKSRIKLAMELFR